MHKNAEEFEKEFDEYNEGRHSNLFKAQKEEAQIEYNSTGHSGTRSTSETMEKQEHKKRFWFFGGSKEEEPQEKPALVEENNNEELKQDLKEISRISFGMMQKLPKEELAKFKSSEEFIKFREILTKHKIIK